LNAGLRHPAVRRLLELPVFRLLDYGIRPVQLGAAMLPECEAALGIDVVPEFIEAANEAKRILKLDKARFEYTFLNNLDRDRQKYRLPYQTLLMINTYHYLYWGSAYCPTHWPDQDYLLRTAGVALHDRMLFMSPLEVIDCPFDIVRRAREHPDWPSTTPRQNSSRPPVAISM